MFPVSHEKTDILKITEMFFMPRMRHTQVFHRKPSFQTLVMLNTLIQYSFFVNEYKDRGSDFQLWKKTLFKTPKGLFKPLRDVCLDCISSPVSRSLLHSHARHLL